MKKLLIIAVLFSACMTVERATEKVLSNRAAKDRVGREWEKENPCLPVAPKPGKPDTVYLPSDTIPGPADTSYIPGDTTVITLTKIVNKTMVIRDTMYADTTDYRRLGIALDSARYWFLKHNVVEAEKNALKAEQKNAAIMFRYFIVALLKTWQLWLLLTMALAGFIVYRKLIK